MGKIAAAMLAASLVMGAPARAQRTDAPDLVLLNGKIVTLDASGSVREALAVRDGRILAVGRSAEIRKLAGPQTRRVDLKGRAVIPGLIDSHMHAIRAALFFANEVNWIGTHSIDEAMQRIRDAARERPGQWLIVAGGWTPEQFKERRRPTQAELAAAAPDNPVYVQLFYEAALLSPAGLKTLGIASDADIPPRGKLQRDAQGNATGWIEGDNPTITKLFDRLPLPSFEQKVRGTRLFFHELNRLAMTGVVDPGGFNMTPADYQPLFKVWQDRDLTVRVVYSMFAQRPGKELEDFKNLTQLLPMGFGDDLLRFNGIGESVTWGMYNNDQPSDAQKAELLEVGRWAAGRGMTLTIHWNNDVSASELLGVFDQVNQERPIAPLRWSIAHLNDASPGTLKHMKSLGVGWTMQDAMYFSGDAFIKKRGAAEASRTPPIMTALGLGVPVGGGTDAHRVMSYNPFVSLQWMLDGKTVAGTPTRGPGETPSREQALRLYTQGSAWFAHDEERRGSLVPGKLADLAVLTKDFMTAPVSDIGSIESLLTLVGGRVVYASGPYRELLPQR